jgi:hypothetical protein
MPPAPPSMAGAEAPPLSLKLPSSKAEERKARPSWSLAVAWEAPPKRRTLGERALRRSPGPVLSAHRSPTLVRKLWMEERMAERRCPITSPRFHEA